MTGERVGKRAHSVMISVRVELVHPGEHVEPLDVGEPVEPHVRGGIR